MKIWKVLLVMAAFMIMLPISLNLLFFTRFSFEFSIGQFSFTGFTVLVYLALPGLVGTVAGLCAVLGERTPSPHQAQGTGRTFKYGRRQQLEADMAQLEQQAPIHSPAPIAITEPVQPVAEEPAQPTLTIVPEQTASAEIVVNETEPVVQTAPAEQMEDVALINAIEELLQNHERDIVLSQEQQYSTSEPGEDMTEALASLIKAVNQEEPVSQEWTSSVNTEELDKGFEEMLATEPQWPSSTDSSELDRGFEALLVSESENLPSHFSNQDENEFFNSVIPFHEYQIIKQRYGEEIVNKITTTPEMGPREFHDVMLVEISNGEIEYGGKQTKLTGNIPNKEGVVLIRGQFVSSDTFRILSWDSLEAIKSSTPFLDNEEEGKQAL